MPKDTISLHQAYKSLEKVLSELTDDNSQNTERNQSADLFKRIADKLEDNKAKLSSFEQLAKLSAVSHLNINLLLINPLYKDNVADLVSQLNLDLQKQNSEEFEILEFIIQQFKEFIELSRLAEAAASASHFEKLRHFNHLKTLGSMTKLQFSILLTHVKQFLLDPSQQENTKIKIISLGLIDYLNESAVAKIDFSTATFLKNYCQTDSKTLQASFKEDKESFENILNNYLNAFKPEAKKNQSDDVTSTQEENQSDDDDIFHDAIDDEIFHDALVEQETKLLACKPTENQNNFKNLIIYILIVSLNALDPFLNPVKISLFLNFVIEVIEFLEKIKKDPNVRTPLRSNWNDIPQTTPNLARNGCGLFNLNKTNQQTDKSGLNNQPIISS